MLSKNIPKTDTLCPLNQWQTIEIPNDLCGERKKKKNSRKKAPILPNYWMPPSLSIRGFF